MDTPGTHGQQLCNGLDLLLCGDTARALILHTSDFLIMILPRLTARGLPGTLPFLSGLTMEVRKLARELLSSSDPDSSSASGTLLI